MAHDRRFRFGVTVMAVRDRAGLVALARRAETLGYDAMLFADHFGDHVAPLTAMATAAAATTRLRIGSMVLANDYRHPLVLAKELATLDLLSDGRLEVGLGTGWMRADYDAAGIPLDPPGVRVDRFEEGLAVIAGLLGPDPVDHQGRYYRIADHPGRPRPVQQPRPPILVGGGGRRILGIAARHADIVGVNPSIPGGAIDLEVAHDGTAEATDRKLAWIRDAAGPRYDDLELTVTVAPVTITDDRDAAAADRGARMLLRPDQMLDHPHQIFGTVDQIVDTLRARRDRWDLSYIVFQQNAMEAMAPVVARLAGT